MKTILCLCFGVLIFTGTTDAEPSGKASAYYDFGVFAYQDGDYQDAEKNLKKAVELDNTNPFYHHFLGKVYLKTGDYARAAQYLDMAWQKNPDIPELRYDRAMLYFKTERYAEASELFTEVFRKDPCHILARYHAAVSLFKAKRSADALVHFEEIAKTQKSLSDNCHLYAGACYLEHLDFQKAIDTFEYLRNQSSSSDIKESAKKWLDIARQQQQRFKPYTLYLKTSYQHDDNVRLQPSDASEDTKDQVFEAYLFGRYNLLNEKDKKFAVSYSHYQTIHQDLSEYDMTGSIFGLSFKYLKNPLGFEISYLPSYYWVDNKRYMMREQIKPQLTWNISADLMTRVSWSYAGSEYFDSKFRDGDGTEFAWDIYYTFQTGYIYGGIAYEKYTAEAEYESYRKWVAKSGLVLNFFKDINLELMGKYTDKPYEAVHPYYQIERKDRQYYASASVSKPVFFPWLSVSVELNHTRNQSEIRDYDYTQTLIGISLTASY